MIISICCVMVFGVHRVGRTVGTASPGPAAEETVQETSFNRFRLRSSLTKYFGARMNTLPLELEEVQSPAQHALFFRGGF